MSKVWIDVSRAIELHDRIREDADFKNSIDYKFLLRIRENDAAIAKEDEALRRRRAKWNETRIRNLAKKQLNGANDTMERC